MLSKSTKDAINVGVIGVGLIGKEHARIYRQLKNANLIGVFDLNQKTANQVAKTFKTQAFDKLSLLFKNLDAVSICTPTTTHYQFAKEAIKRKIATLVEKPMTLTVEEGRNLIKLAGINKVCLAVGHVERFNPIVNILKKSIKKSKVISINITRVGPTPPRIKDVGVILDLGTHDIDLIRFLTNSDFDMVHSVYARGGNHYEDAAILIFKLANGTIASIVTNWFTPYKVRKIEIATMDKFLIGDFIKQRITEYSSYSNSNKTLVAKNISVKKTEPLEEELKDFINSVKSGKNPKVKAEDGLKAVEIALRTKNIPSEVRY